MGAQAREDLLRAGERAIAAADWETAQGCLERALEEGDSPDALTGLSKVAMFQREYERAIELRERAFDLYKAAGELAGASESAIWLTFMYATYHGNFSAALGWKERAASVLDGTEETAAHGWLTLMGAPFSRDPAEREQLAVSALAIARRFGDVDLEIEALALLGEAYVVGGQVVDGMRLLDEAMAAVTAGRVRDHFALGEIYCRLLSACEAALDVGRATDWLSMVDRYVVWTDFVRPTCRTHYGGILVALGRWAEAETELLAAIEGFDRGYRGDRMFAALRLADLRMRQGRVEEAERLLEGGEWHPTARRLAATIALARGDTALASELGELCAEGSKLADPTCAPALEVLIVTRLTIGNLPAAHEAADRLATIARASGLERLDACAALAEGRVAAAQGDGGQWGSSNARSSCSAPWSCHSRRRGRNSSSHASSRSRHQPQRCARPSSRSRRSSASARCPMPTQRPACCAASGPSPDERGLAEQRRSHAARTRCWACSQKAARTPRSRSGS